MAVVSFFFDCADATSLVAALRLQDAALRTGARIDWLPVRAGDLPAPAPPLPAAARYATKDLADWARFTGVRLAVGRTSPAAAAAAAERLAGIADPVARGRAAEAWLRAAHAAGADPDATGEVAADTGAAARDQLAANARRLLELGGWRVPAFAVGDDLYVGPGRISLVELALTHASEYRIIPPGSHSQGAAADPAEP